jgi:hypothetical protein
MTPLEAQVQRMADREIAAWRVRDAKVLYSLLHPDMVWPCPPDATAYDPARWVFPFGRYDHQQWKAEWEWSLRTHDLGRNRRTTAWKMVSEQDDGAFAIADVDTL